MAYESIKYPRTPHLEGSRLQPGDEDLDQVSFASLEGAWVVVEEKVDGANASVRFDEGAMRLQSRGHVLTGGPRERQFGLFKTWAQCHQRDLFEVLGARYVMYGEWLYAKHTVFYDRLPHYFLEFDVLDRETGLFLSTAARRRLLEGLAVVSVPVLSEGPLRGRAALEALVTASKFKSPGWRAALATAARDAGVDPERAARETDTHDQMEGLYLKVETGDACVGRLKWVRHSFLTAIADSGSHWADRPIVVNGLAEGVDLFAF
ncbi:MAG: RNA ligase family protein [Myxococcales bacterium]|nr:RNA ligase family protein [Myxococcales bacterium]